MHSLPLQYGFESSLAWQTLSITMLSITMLSISGLFEKLSMKIHRHYAECCALFIVFAEFRYAKCRYAECLWQ